jgi:hypothetical protein
MLFTPSTRTLTSSWTRRMPPGATSSPRRPTSTHERRDPGRPQRCLHSVFFCVHSLGPL